MTISNDGATILKLLEVEHPAAKVLVELADLQDREVGDGTTSVVLIAAELLKVWEIILVRTSSPGSTKQTSMKESKRASEEQNPSNFHYSWVSNCLS